MKYNYSENDLDNTDTGSKLESVNREFLDNIIFEPNRFKVPYIQDRKNTLMFNYKSTKLNNAMKNYNKKQTETNFTDCAIWILEKG